MLKTSLFELVLLGQVVLRDAFLLIVVQPEIETDSVIWWEMLLSLHVLYLEIDVMAVWATVVATCPHHLKVDIWYVVKQKVIVWPATQLHL